MAKSKTVNKVVKFWPKLLSRVIDMVIAGVVILASAYFMVEKVNGKIQFIETWMFYVWTLITMITFFVVFILIPILWKGKSIGNFVSRVKVVSEKNLTKSILKREMFFGWAWIVLVIGIATIVNHTLIVKVASSQKEVVKKIVNGVTKDVTQGVVYKGWDAVRVAMFSSLAGILTLVQMIFGISGLVKKDGISLHDKIAGSKVVWINKFVKEEKEAKAKTIKPMLVKNNSVDWI